MQVSDVLYSLLLFGTFIFGFLHHVKNIAGGGEFVMKPDIA